MKQDRGQDSINRAAWRSRSARNGYGRASGWTDPGEAAAFAWLAERIRGQPILDIGVGGGRTVPLLTALSTDYIAVDYTPELVEICQRNHPGIQVRHMDARDLSAFADACFGLVAFSYNGIDAVDHAGRLAILGECARVLRPGGYLLFSTHNLHGPSYRRRPSDLLRLPRRDAGLVEFGRDTLRILYALPVGAFNYLRHTRLDQIEDGYATRVCAAHRFGIVILYTDFATQRRQLADAGLHFDVAFGNADGARVDETVDLSREEWIHFIARKRSHGDG
ncbi:class I SAM-dependent methyltransferase [Burkholderia sp. FERM BP-3421]|uniref:class I SAM-dependent methyltransferase n=1 Tax=Burkholderia sp. FERM BP-3421 TaxID=1494466 RepID=UPI00235F6968|nr:class I SAM-dependent methyltransferase [Burkholderia sp. FERM BP-3421]WDD95741.1 class I SAM-dependent methyltransferase [Burkholderia sp. FERM BP-3421]